MAFFDYYFVTLFITYTLPSTNISGSGRQRYFSGGGKKNALSTARCRTHHTTIHLRHEDPSAAVWPLLTLVNKYRSQLTDINIKATDGGWRYFCRVHR